MLEINNLKVVFNKNTVNEKVALDGIDLRLEDGDFATVIGSNGAGKSTLFNAIGGDIEVESGSIVNNGRDITYEKEHKRAKYIGRLFQDPLKGTAPHMTIEENLGLAYYDRGRLGLGFAVNKKQRDFFRQVLKNLGIGLEDRLKQPVGLLSGGQRQSLTLLMATLKVPELLLLDEHTAALDPKASKRILEITCDIVKKHNITTMMITHNINDALKYGNKTIVMNRGKILTVLEGEQRKSMDKSDIMKLYTMNNEELSDRMILS